MKISKLNENNSNAMRFKLVDHTKDKSELKVDKPTAVVFDDFSDEDYDSAKESNNGYSAEDLICVNPKRRDENHDNSL